MGADLVQVYTDTQPPSRWFAWERGEENNSNNSDDNKTKIIYAFRICGKQAACSGLEPHLHNSADLIGSALAPSDTCLTHFRWGGVFCLSSGFKAAGEDLN